VGMIGFHLLFPDEASGECRTVIPVGRANLPHRTFVFMEAYCADPQCDCRRVMLNVIDAETHNQVTPSTTPSSHPSRRSRTKDRSSSIRSIPRTAMSQAFRATFHGANLASVDPETGGRVHLYNPRWIAGSGTSQSTSGVTSV
jgi:hypothetical protein